MATEEKKEPARRRRAAAVPAEDGAVEKPARPTRARKSVKAAAAADPSAAAAPTGPATEAAPVVAAALEAEVAPPPASAEAVGAPSASTEVGTASTHGEGPAAPVPVEVVLTHEEAGGVLGKLLELSGLKAALEFQDAADGSLSVAVHFDPVPAGIQAGRRTPLMDSLQFLTNKLVNRPGSASRRWVALGAMGHPAPRPAPGTKPVRAPAPTAAPAEVQAPVPAKAAQVAQQPARPQREAAPSRLDERSLTVSEDPSLAAESLRLSENSARLGRFYVLFPMGEADRARVVQAAAGTPGVRVSCEGEGRHRRVVFKPDVPTPLPKQTLPDYDDEDDDDGDDDA